VRHRRSTRLAALVTALFVAAPLVASPAAVAQTPHEVVIHRCVDRSSPPFQLCDVFTRVGTQPAQPLTNALQQVRDAREYGTAGFVEPVFSPSRRYIAATLFEGSSQSVVVIDRRTGAYQKQHAAQYRGYRPRWAPDGRWLVWIRDHSTLVTSSFAWARSSSMEASSFGDRPGEGVWGTSRREGPIAGVQATSADWSPDGDWIAFGRTDGAIGVVRPDGTQRRTLQRGDGGHLTEPAWSPDGQQLAAVRLFDDEERWGEIVTLPADGSAGPTVVASGERWGSPSWSVDGRQLVFAGHDGNVHVAGGDGSGRTALERSSAEDGAPHFYWTPIPRGRELACPPGEVPSAGFRDVVAGNVHRPAIDCAVWWNIAQGTGDGTTYLPEDGVRRDQMAAFIARMLEEVGADLPASPRNHFDDDDGTTHELRINQLAELGVVRGTGTRRFGPREIVTRAQMASFIARALEEVTERPTSPRDWFGDDDGGTHEPNINALAGLGIAAGVDRGVYAPAAPVRRDQMASFLIRSVDLLVEREVAVPPSDR
jgi:hypothetical protein